MKRKFFLKSALIGATAGVLGAGKGMIDLSHSGKVQPKIIRNGEGNLLKILGNDHIMTLVGEDTGDGMTEWMSISPVGAMIPPHIHTREDEIFRVYEGELEVMVGKKTHYLKAGDIAFAPKDIVHSWKVVGSSTAKFSTSAYPSGMEHMFEEIAALPPGPPNFEKIFEISARYGINFI